jgi:hypothetical protein
MTTITISGGFEADLRETGDVSLQGTFEKLKQTHFGGNLPEVSVFAVTRFKHPTEEMVHAFALKTEESPELRDIGTPWAILIHENYCALPGLAQYLLHEMTHVLLPNENPFHSAHFWATLREKWMLDLNLVMGVGLNGDEIPSGLTKEILSLTKVCHLFGL